MLPKWATCQELLSAYLELLYGSGEDSSVLCIDFGPLLTSALLLEGFPPLYTPLFGN